MFYLAGKISGFQLWNTIIAFYWYRKLLKIGMWVYSPHMASLFVSDTTGYEEWMARDFKIITDMCEGVVMLPNWERSPGAMRELELAKKWNLDIIYINKDIYRILKKNYVKK